MIASGDVEAAAARPASGKEERDYDFALLQYPIAVAGMASESKSKASLEERDWRAPYHGSAPIVLAWAAKRVHLPPLHARGCLGAGHCPSSSQGVSEAAVWT